MSQPAAPLTARQRRIFELLLELFLSRGFAEFTVDSAARELHCSKTTLYALGASRDEILTRVLVGFFQQATARTNAATAGAPTRRAELRAYFTAMSEAMSPASAQFVHDMATDPVGARVYALNTQAATERIQDILARGAAAGEFRGVAATSAGFVARLIEAEMDRIRRGEYADILPTQQAYAELGELLLRGISAGGWA